jgi:general secretion pathway protein A
MYLDHFGLHEPPFRATPDPRLFYSNPAYREAYATLLYGVLERKGFIVLTGEIGTGKTTLLRRLMDQLGSTVRFVFFYNTTLTFDETVEFVCGELELPVAGLSRVQSLQRLNDALVAEATRGGRVVLLLDEAQNLGFDVLENLRLISNLETSTEKLLQIVLVGQPELGAKLADPALRQVTQRIAVRFHLAPLHDGEIEPYIAHRLRHCGRPRQDLFTTDAIHRVGTYSNGIPRLINILCDGALLAAYAADARRVKGAMIDEVALDLKLRRRDDPSPRTGELTVEAPKRAGLRRARARSRPVAFRLVLASLAALTVAASAVVLLPGSPITRLYAGGSETGRMHPVATAGEPADEPAAPARASGSAAEPARGVVELEAAAAPRSDPAAIPAAATLGPRRATSVDLPPRPPAVTTDRREDWGTAVPQGKTLSDIAFQHYGARGLFALDLMKDLNPHIGDLDRVAAGEQLRMPTFTPNTLARPQPDGSYHLIVASLTTPALANRLAERMRRSGYRARVQTRDLTTHLQAHRVLIEDLESWEALSDTWRAAQELSGAPTSQDQR